METVAIPVASDMLDKAKKNCCVIHPVMISEKITDFIKDVVHEIEDRSNRGSIGYHYLYKLWAYTETECKIIEDLFKARGYDCRFSNEKTHLKFYLTWGTLDELYKNLEGN